jgi:hypothetical protein
MVTICLILRKINPNTVAGLNVSSSEQHRSFAGTIAASADVLSGIVIAPSVAAPALVCRVGTALAQATGYENSHRNRSKKLAQGCCSPGSRAYYYSGSKVTEYLNHKNLTRQPYDTPYAWSYTSLQACDLHRIYWIVILTDIYMINFFMTIWTARAWAASNHSKC